MAEHLVDLSIDTDDNEFHTRFSGIVDEIRVLPRSNIHHGPLNPHQVLNIGFTENGEIPGHGEVGQLPIVRAKMRLDSYYLNGFQRLSQEEGGGGGYRDGEQVFELRDNAEFPHTLQNLCPGSIVRYPNILQGRNMGLFNFVGAVKALANNLDPQRNLISIALTVSESVRFRWISDHFTTIFETGQPWELQQWMADMIHSWGPLSKRARDFAAMNALNEADLPIEPDDVDDLLMQTRNYDLLLDPENGPRMCAVCVMKLKH